MGHDGKVPCRRAKCRDPHPTQVEFGEQVMAKYSRLDQQSSKKNPLAKRAVQGTWVGVHDATSENIVATEDARTIRTRTRFRMPKDKRWNAEAIKSIRATPARLVPDDDASEIPILREDVLEEFDLAC